MPIIVGLGVDIVHLPRIVSLISRRGHERFARRILSQDELTDWKHHECRDASFLAVRFSVKEATYKALYPIVKPTWKEVTYRSFGQIQPASKPNLQYRALGGKNDASWRFHVSVSHDGDYIMSTVLVEGS